MPEPDFRARVDAARDRHNLSDIVGRHTGLKKRGSRELVGLCCFHQERTPSLEVNDAKGTYHCHGCGAGGDAITFLMRAEGMTFRGAVETLSGDRFPTISLEERAMRKADDARLTAARIAEANAIWNASVPTSGTLAEEYARSRGIHIELPATVRFASTYRWRDPETGEVGRNYPAVVCALQDATGDVVGVQCIFLRPDGRGKYERVRDDGSKAKAKLTRGVIVGSALRLGPVGRHIILCEGPEDGWTLAQANPFASIWVACGTALMPRIALPSEVECLTLAGDNGVAGRAAVDQAQSEYMAQGIAVRAMFPDEGFKDWNDQLRGVRS